MLLRCGITKKNNFDIKTITINASAINLYSTSSKIWIILLTLETEQTNLIVILCRGVI